MKALPFDAISYKKTPVFTQATMPKALLERHSSKAGSWGKIWVLSGQLCYRILTDLPGDYTLTPDLPGIIEPQVFHHVEPMGAVEFYVEFYRT
ncbi:putative S-adenosyl-L-methionine-dependent methyltransferase TehB [Acaryochloris thomasi RCC1774]|uniref:Putative S-adenosyl-L-methionine-dependent methyltransferase TehB n=1 Tax=Acaryochloris thomasi RCC1774 TaxID=1764569 RepID=A0A2W1JAH0_9CYAN|nr:DUF1971 domain-containing protein [Acaryochloris thomasi]PZD71150.1 putative S-adenosyl-L-methionine-dependent methyltransferase TehB [Acaryochloris thomasi RCC1774]